MSRIRGALAAVGVAAVGVGLLFVLQPALAAGLSVPRAALYLLAAIALVEGLRSIRARRLTAVQGAELPEPEGGIPRSRPGDEFDRLLVRWSTWRDHRRIASVDDRVVDRLTEVAIEAVADRHAVSRATAADRVAAGTWTDDPIAAAFLGGEAVPSPPWTVRLRGIVRTGSTSRFTVTRTVGAIAALWEER